MNDVINHYNSLIDEGNDPVHDSSVLKEYMDKWDGMLFIDELHNSKNKDVLEIGVGTGRIAIKVAPFCRHFEGIDISLKTISRAKDNLKLNNNIHLICDDFLLHEFQNKYDIIYSSLTFMHFQNKQIVMHKIASLLKQNGRVVLSIEKSQATEIDCGTRKIKIYPDSPDEIIKYAMETELVYEKMIETEFAYILCFTK